LLHMYHKTLVKKAFWIPPNKYILRSSITLYIIEIRLNKEKDRIVVLNIW